MFIEFSRIQKIVLIFFIVVFSSILAISSQARSLAEIKKTQEARVCTASGIEFMNEFSRKQTTLFFQTVDKNIQIKFEQIKWDEMFHNEDGTTVKEAVYTPQLLATGQCDLYPSNLTITEWRKKKLAFTVEYVARNMVIVNKAQRKRYTTSKDLAGKVVAVTKGSSYLSWLEGQNESVFAHNSVKFQL